MLSKLGPHIQWVESFVTDGTIYRVYIALDEATVREHPALGGFPANSVAQVRRMIDPTTSEGGQGAGAFNAKRQTPNAKR